MILPTFGAQAGFMIQPDRPLTQRLAACFGTPEVQGSGLFWGLNSNLQANLNDAQEASVSASRFSET